MLQVWVSVYLCLKYGNCVTGVDIGRIVFNVGDVLQVWGMQVCV